MVARDRSVPRPRWVVVEASSGLDSQAWATQEWATGLQLGRTRIAHNNKSEKRGWLRDSLKRASFDLVAVAHLPKSSRSLETCCSAQAARPYDSHQTSNGPGRPGGGAGTRKCTKCANAATKGAHRQSVGLHLRVLLLLLATLCCCRPSFLGRSPLLLIFQHVLPTFRLLLRRPLRRHHLFHLRGMLF